jgi:protein gp37
MGKTSIEWTDASWNPIVGCTEVSPGCANCYAARLAASRLAHVPAYKGLAIIPPNEAVRGQRHVRWTGKVRWLRERRDEPKRWKKARRIFVCDMGDLFHEDVKDEWIEHVMTVFMDCKRHTFQVLTKRPERMFAWFSKEWKIHGHWAKPLPNVWLGVSVENQHFAFERIPLLLDTPAAVRFLSCEPLLGPLDLTCNLSSDGVRPDGIRTNFLTGQWWDHTGYEQTRNENNPHGFPRQKLDWVICGGESGPHARPMHPDWARSLRDQCQAAGVPFFFKQWGEWGPPFAEGPEEHIGPQFMKTESGDWLTKIGKKLSGRLLDGREWNEFPGV